MNNKLILGIDLGTTFSCVAVFINNNVEIIANNQGNRTTPSYVSFNKNERLVGDGAKSQITSNPTNTIFDAKRLIGRDFSDLTQEDLIHWPFKVVNIDSKPKFQVEYENETRIFSPEEISSAVLSEMKRIASDYLGFEVTDAVITVPAYFNDAQRQATKDAGMIAGLNVLRIINEPTAAALAYGLDKITNKESNILVFDFGGGTLDCTILNLNGGVFEVKAVSGNGKLGGQDIDNKLVTYCIEEFKRKSKIDIGTNPKAISRLRTQCENAKRILSTTMQTMIEVDSLSDGVDFSYSLTRARFENLCGDIFTKIMEPVNKVISDSGLNKTQIDEIILVGGSTRIPKIKQMLSDYFGKKLNESVNPDEAVAYGAAIQGAILSDANHAHLEDIVLLDVTPLSLGIEISGGLMVNIIDRNTTIPCKKSKLFTTHSDNQQNVRVQIFEGERKFTKDCNNLGTFRLEGISPATRKTPQIEVTFELDANGILNVKAINKSNSQSQNLTITNNRGRFSSDDIERLINEAKKFEADDNERRMIIEAKNELEIYVCSVKLSLSEPNINTILNSDEKNIVEGLCAEIADLLEDKSAENKTVYNSMKKKLEDIWNPIMVRVYEVQSNKMTEKLI